MFVVWKLNQELARGGRVAKGEAHIVSRRNLRVAARADHRLRSLEKLRTMATNTRIMPGIVGNVRKVPHFFPVVGGNFMAGVAGSLMLFRGVGKS